MNHDWNSAFPKEPEQFHERVQAVLQNLPEERSSKVMKKKIWGCVAAACALALCSVSTYAAVQHWNWNRHAVEEFNVDEPMQEKLTEENYARVDKQSVTDNGVTITLEQTVQDENLVYLLFNITAEDEELTTDHSMHMQLKYSNGKDPYLGMAWGFVDDLDQPEESNGRLYEVWLERDLSYDFTDSKINWKFTALEGAPEVKAGIGKILAEGDWSFEIDTSNTNSAVSYGIDKDIVIGGCSVHVDEIKLSPLSYTLSCNGADVKKLAKKQGVNWKELEGLASIQLSGICYDDGSVIGQEYGVMREHWGKTYVATGRFTTVVDVEKITGFILGDETEIEVR